MFTISYDIKIHKTNNNNSRITARMSNVFGIDTRPRMYNDKLVVE